MLTGSERAPESTATVPRGNPDGSCPASDSGTGSKVSDAGSTLVGRLGGSASGAPTFPDTAAI